MRQQQKGFTLLEIVVTIGIVGAIVMTVALAVTTLLANSQQPTTRQILLQQVQQAGYQMPRDIQMSSNVTLSGPNGFPCTINIPVDQNPSNDYSVKYLFDSDKLKRQQYDSSGNLTAETLIAQYVDTDNTTLANAADSYKLTIRASIGAEIVTASYEMRRRLAGAPE